MCAEGEGLVTRGLVCCLSSSRCSNIFFFVMIPNTILKHTLALSQVNLKNKTRTHLSVKAGTTELHETCYNK